MIVEEVGVPKATIVEEARGLRTCDASRLGDLVVLDFKTPCRHLVMDGVVTIVYMNSILARLAAVLGFEANKVEDTKFKASENSASSPGGCDPWRTPHLCTLCDGRWRHDWSS